MPFRVYADVDIKSFKYFMTSIISLYKLYNNKITEICYAYKTPKKKASGVSVLKLELNQSSQTNPL